MIVLHTAWSERAEAGLCKVLGEDRDSILEGVNAGRLQLWELNSGTTWLVTCVEADTKELIVCCIQGNGLKHVADLLWRTMKEQGLKRARWFTQRPALAAALKRQRYPVKLLGHVYVVEVPNVA
jgi:hypothetical protein